MDPGLAGGLWGCLVTLVLAFLLVVVTIFVFGGGGGWVSFRNGMILMPIVIGVWVVPISVVLGLVYAIIRRAVGIEREVIAVPDEG